MDHGSHMYILFMRHLGLISCFIIGLLQSLMGNCISDQELHKKIGEMLIVGFDDSEFIEGSLIAENIEQHHIGGVILFSSFPEWSWQNKKCGKRNIINPQQLRKLINNLQDHAKKNRNPEEGALFIAMDQEGGYVSRLSAEDGFIQENLSAKELGNINDLAFTYNYAQELAKYLKMLGINLNFAPVIDLAVNSDNFIYKKERCFGNNPDRVYEQAKAFARGMHNNGIKTTLKHFPGHGNSAGDTHKGMVDITETWDIKELEPYQRFIDSGYCELIMISHVINQKLDSTHKIKNKSGEMGLAPATFSGKMVTELLRKQMGFKGVIVSDDLCMGAITNEYSFEDTLKYAINSGIDILILANHEQDRTKDAIEIIQRLVDDGIIKRERIEQSYEKIIKLKLKRDDN